MIYWVKAVGHTETFEMSAAIRKSFIVRCSLVANFQYTKQSRFFKNLALKLLVLHASLRELLSSTETTMSLWDDSAANTIEECHKRTGT